MEGRFACVACVALLVAGLAAPLAAQTSGPNLSSYEHFTLQYTDPQGRLVQLHETDSYFPKYYLGWGTYLVTLWQIRIPGAVPASDVWVGAFHNPYTREFFMGLLHPTGVPPGWRVDFVEQRYDVKFPPGAELDAYRFVLPKVYGPTFYAASVPRRELGRYPVFLQTQQVTLEDRVNGGAMTVYTDDDHGLRKDLGFETNGTLGGVRFLARFLPDQGTHNPLSILWLANYRVRVEYGLEGFEQAIDFYRKQQLARTTSFLSSRQPAAKTIHPYVRDSKFAVGVGATLSTVQLAGGQYDVSPPYRQGVLDYFSKLHGRGLQTYHLGWYLETPLQPLVVPDAFETITPGHRAFIREAELRRMNIRAVGSTLPGVMHPQSRYFAPGIVRLDADGSQSTFTVPAWPGADYRNLCYYPQAVTELYAGIYRNRIFSQFGFSGSYLDALSPAPQCYGFHQHQHPADRNAQRIGIQRLIAAIRGQEPPTSAKLVSPVLYQETPFDCLPTDGSGLDLNTWDPAYGNLFRMTYTGEEWPTWGVVFGWDILGNRPSGYEYARELANCLAGGARPLILWPEIHGVLPVDPGGDAEFAVFEQMLADYVKNWDGYWRKIIFGRQFEPLDPDDLLSSYIEAASPLLATGDPVTDRWQLPGYQPRPEGQGCFPSRLRGNSSAAVMTGLFEPSDQVGCRWVVLYRWTDPTFGSRLKLPGSHPLNNQTETVRLALSAQNVRSRPGALVRLLDPATQRFTPLGRLPVAPQEKTGLLSAPLEGPGLKIVVIE